MSFYPRLREGGDKEAGSGNGAIRVSTHASAREATINLKDLTYPLHVSTHASAREATVDRIHMGD